MELRKNPAQRQIINNFHLYNLVKRIHQKVKRGLKFESIGQINFAEDEYTEALNLLNYPEIKNLNLPEIDKMSYYTYRNLGRLHFNKNSYNTARLYLKKSLKSREAANDTIQNLCNTKRMLCHIEVLEALYFDDIYLLLEAEKHCELLEKELELRPTEFNESFIRELKYERKLIEEIKKNNVWTIVKLQFPTPIYTDDQHEFEFTYKGIKRKVSFRLVKSNTIPFIASSNSEISIDKDKFGLVSQTEAIVNSNAYIEPHEVRKISVVGEVMEIFNVHYTALEVLNYFIERYRIVTNEYWIEQVLPLMIYSFYTEIRAGDQIIHRLPFNTDRVIKVSPRTNRRNANFYKKLTEYLAIEEIPLWKLLLQNAKDYLLTNRFRESIMTINEAFENYLELYARKTLAKKLGSKKATSFFDGEPIYEDFELKDYMDEETFRKAVKNGKIRKNHPSVWKIIRKLLGVAPPANVSNRYVKKLVALIRKKRNYVAHGDILPIDEARKSALEAIEAFEKFRKIFPID